MLNKLSGNKERFSGFAEIYDIARPKPPTALYDIIKTYSAVKPEYSVTDLGCGTGQSTIFWNDFSSKIFGIKPNSDMINIARLNKKQENKNETI